MNKGILLGLFVVVAVFQLAIPGSIIYRENKVVTAGQEMKFQMRMFDPGDPFRGNYLQLAFEQENSTAFRQGPPGAEYVVVTVGEDGFAKVTGVMRARPKATAYFRASSMHGRRTFPFNRFFINEYQAKEAERILRDAQRNEGATDTYALVRVGQGDAVLMDLYVHGKPLREALAQ